MKKNRGRKGLSSPELGIGTARERTRAHLEYFLRASTTLGAGLVLACEASAQTSKPPQVCDPLPLPVGCCENPDELLVRGCLDQQTRWVKSGTRWTLQLSLGIRQGPVRMSFAGLKREAIKVSGVLIRDMRVEPRKVGFVLAAGANSRHANMQFPVLCNDKKVLLKLVLDLSKPPSENGSVPIKLMK